MPYLRAAYEALPGETLRIQYKNHLFFLLLKVSVILGTTLLALLSIENSKRGRSSGGVRSATPLPGENGSLKDKRNEG